MRFKKNMVPWNKGKKLSHEHKQKLSDAKLKNPVRYWLGKKRPDVVERNKKGLPVESYLKMVKTRRSRENYNHSDETKEKLKIISTGRKKSIETRKKISNSKRLEKHPNWKGGLSSFISRMRNHPKIKEWKKTILKRDKYNCVECGSKSELHVHHIKSFANIFYEYNIKTIDEFVVCDELFKLKNGITLCKKCHQMKHSVIFLK